MRHLKKGKKFNRTRAERESLYKNLINSLFIHERIKTTESKAKVIRPLAERWITEAKKQNLAARKRIQGFFPTDQASQKLYYELAERFSSRMGGYTRILKLGPRSSDQTRMAMIELLDRPEKKEESKKKEDKKNAAPEKGKKEKKEEK